MLTPKEAKQRETEIRDAVQHLNGLIRSSCAKGVRTRLYINESASENGEGVLSFCDITIVPSSLQDEQVTPQ